MALKLDLSLDLDGLGLKNLSLSVPDPRSPGGSPPSHTTPDPADHVQDERWETETNSSQSIVTFGSCPSIAPPLSDLPLTPIPELLHTPTPLNRTTMPIAGRSPIKTAPVSNIHPRAYTHATAYAHSGKQQQQKQQQQKHLASTIPSPLDREPILAQLAQGENDIGIIKNVRYLPTIHDK
jgi:hypothetical protein